MTMKNRLLVAVCLMMLAGGVCFGQDKSDAAAPTPVQAANGKHYQVVFVVQEVEGSRVINGRRYVTDMAFYGAKSPSGSIRTGSKVPIPTGSNASSGVPTSFMYVDIGFNVDFNSAQLEGDNVYLWLTADLSSVDPADNQLHQPTIRSNKWMAGVTVPLSKPTVVFSSDDLSSKRTVQIELTVRPVK
jgi:hypothetical protein